MECLPWSYCHFKVRKSKIKMRQFLFISSIQRRKVEVALPLCLVPPVDGVLNGFDLKETIQPWCWQLCHTESWRPVPGAPWEWPRIPHWKQQGSPLTILAGVFCQELNYWSIKNCPQHSWHNILGWFIGKEILKGLSLGSFGPTPSESRCEAPFRRGTKDWHSNWLCPFNSLSWASQFS